ncbi:MAG TPA: molecular chaperone DnaJ [Chromatiaceae bacterium]|jgi:DnaJ-class molecular chaperone|nr:MAG: hypothetical protein N838_04985 [Thiohalocapsa sp. PB-PSB1]QQO53830.1 MAG: molecular chaperone DnaJ [Thiohalocapsa sp. PB-PSB1]HBG94507.1 molecular chaperone DnaJ [Chromatiaceae bacterium]HCS88875.1 molecular chaperone DnaJ [Chromatiaceae bacterium]
MRDPYLILGVDEDTDDAGIETAYLQGIKYCPPERDAERFGALRSAFETLRTSRKRIAYQMCNSSLPQAADILDKAAPIGPPDRPDIAAISALLRGER